MVIKVSFTKFSLLFVATVLVEIVVIVKGLLVVVKLDDGEDAFKNAVVVLKIFVVVDIGALEPCVDADCGFDVVEMEEFKKIVVCLVIVFPSPIPPPPLELFVVLVDEEQLLAFPQL
uniref:Transmembrane protein n=1 Tax=Panagrolaimus davidi TaxID=227884 RepID=A0A914QLW4_9BILA